MPSSRRKTAILNKSACSTSTEDDEEEDDVKENMKGLSWDKIDFYQTIREDNVWLGIVENIVVQPFAIMDKPGCVGGGVKGLKWNKVGLY